MENEKNGWDELKDFILKLPESLQPTAIDDSWFLLTTGLIKNYLWIANEIKYDKRRKPEIRRANLQKILTPILLIQKAHSLRLLGKEKENLYRINFSGKSYFPFIADDHINTNEEIDLSKLHYNRKKYFIDPHSFCQEFFDTISARITLQDGSPDRMTFHECYLHKLPTITQGTMKSSDLLDRLIVTYAIKRALNGDGEARQKLVDLYTEKAIKETKKFRIPEIDPPVIAVEILHLLLGGLNEPEALIKYLQSGSRAVSSPFPLWAEKFFIWYFAEYLPPYLEYVAQNTESVNPQCVVAMMNPYSLIHAGFRWNHPQYKHARRFLSYCYRPQKNLNLTTWLFAPFPAGTFRLLLQQTRKELKQSKQITSQPNYDDSSDDDFVSQDDWLDSKNYKIHRGDEPEEQYFFQSTIDALLKRGDKKTPKKKKLLQRNIQIYRQYKQDKYHQTELAKMHKLTREQVNYIPAKAGSFVVGYKPT